ncbi:hypothetical protein FQN60_012728 [Scomber scombrus]|uniref:Uncharacterized protein n=1 Tax=Scomber scombrus TaxID=13677 RepID=A0AAV1P0F9_SCOSC
MRKRLFSEGRSSSLFSASEIFGVDRSSEFAQKGSRERERERVLPVAAPLSLAPVLSLLSHLPPFCPLAGPLLALPAALPVRRAHQHLVARWFPQLPPPPLLDDITFLALLAPNGVWKSKGRLPFGNASLTESLSASDPRPPLTLFELAI